MSVQRTPLICFAFVDCCILTLCACGYSTPNDVQAEIESRAAERKARVLSDIAAHPWSHSSSTSHPSHAPRSPPRRLSSIMVPSTSASVHEPALVSVSPNESSLYHADPKSPPFTVRKRLSTSLFTDDQHFTSHPRTSSPEPQQPQPHHAATMGPSTLGNRVRPALVGLFSSHSGHHSEGSSSSSLTLSGQHRSNTDPSPQRHRSPAPPAPITLTGPPGYTFILNSDLAEAIRPNLPSRLRIASKWTLLYSLDAHGVSLATLYARTEAGMAGRGMSAGVLLVVKDNDGYVFGAFINEKLRKTEGFYGSGEW